MVEPLKQAVGVTGAGISIVLVMACWASSALLMVRESVVKEGLEFV